MKAFALPVSIVLGRLRRPFARERRLDCDTHVKLATMVLPLT
jgi:hypothetical protein